MKMHCQRLHKATVIMAIASLLLVANAVQATDWPTYRHDNYRSGKTPEKLQANKLETAWTYKAPAPPQPAWAGPAKWDAYAGVRGLKSMRNYDPVFHMIVVGDRLFYGSSVDDSVHCLDTKTGEIVWQFTTNGPVRIAPTHVDGKIYFGSDDGYAYCVDSDKGELVWKFRPETPKANLIVNNGRLIPFWPIRTGVMVDNGTAYFSAGMLPWKSTFLCAVDAVTGKVEGDGRYVKELDNATIEGTLLASVGKIIAPQGRIPPILFDRKTGTKAGQLQGGGGVFVLVTPDDHILHGPGNKTGWITDSNVKTGAKLAAFPNANAMVVHGDVSYILTDRAVVALDRKKRTNLWSADCNTPYDMILANDTLFTGGRDEVVAYDAKSGKKQAILPVVGQAYGFVAANGALFVSTDEGQIVCFRPTGKERKIDETVSQNDSLPPLPPVKNASDKSLQNRWVFHRNYETVNTLKALNSSVTGKINGSVAFQRLGKVEAMTFDGRQNYITLAEDHSKANLPSKKITATAWVRIDEAKQWGGIIGAMQDNGSYERGWILGYNDKKFSMAVSSAKKPQLTYMTAKTPFTLRQWYHVAGVYDGQTLKIYVNGQLENENKEHQGDINYPPKAPFVIGAYKDDNEFFPLKGAIHEVRIYDRVLSADELADQFCEKLAEFPKAKVASTPIDVPFGPYLQFTSPTTATLHYQTNDESPTSVVLSYRGKVMQRFEDKELTLNHLATFKDLRRNTEYEYTLEFIKNGKKTISRSYECDTFFNYSLQTVSTDKTTEVSATTAQLAKQIVQTDKGLCVLVGETDPSLLHEIARRSHLRILAIDTDEKAIAKARKALLKAGCYGSRVVLMPVPSLQNLPLTSEFANIVYTAKDLSTVNASELRRIVRPGGGMLLTKSSIANAKDQERAWAITIKNGMQVSTRPRLSKAGVWSHLYGMPDNSAFGGDGLNGAKSADDLEVQWVGRPGPRANPDRNGRKPAPLSTNGRLFIQGLQRIIALDAYNGTILWSLETPPVGRFNMPRDASNWCADGDHVFVAVNDRCWKIDAATGKMVGVNSVVPAAKQDWHFDWGYLARTGEQLLGSAVKKGTSHTNFWGGSGSGWYDAQGGEVTYQICSDNLFSIDQKDGSRQWQYRDGLIMNATITVGNGKVYFVECRHPKVVKSNERRVGLPEMWQNQYLVALDLKTGEKIWEEPLKVVPGTVVFYLAHHQGQLVLVSSQKKYHTYAFSDKDGKQLWQQEFAWQNGDHGGHMSRPALVDNKIYVRPRVLDAKTGKILDQTMPRGGCGTYACTTDAVIFRAGQVTMWDPDNGKATQWSRLRPDCWLSTIPANGMLLSPEGGGGCSCGSWMETSIAFRPKSRR